MAIICEKKIPRSKVEDRRDTQTVDKKNISYSLPVEISSLFAQRDTFNVLRKERTHFLITIRFHTRALPTAS